MSMRFVVCAAAAVLVLSACTEKPQTAGTRKVDEKSWQAGKTGFVEPGWKAGDQASWEEQMTRRAQAQNEYARTAATP